MADYVLLFRGGDLGESGMSPEEMQDHFAKWRSWLNGLKNEGIFKGGDPLVKSGNVVRSGGVISDGPFAESKEMIGGFIIVDAADIAVANEIAKGCPVLLCDGTVEVRQILIETECH